MDPGLRAELEARQSSGWTALPEVLVVVQELATVADEDDFSYCPGAIV
jgi:hypothetical protein